MVHLNEHESGFQADFLDAGQNWHALMPSFLDVPGVPTEVYINILSASADLYRLAPWHSFDHEIPLAVSSPSYERPRACVLLGAAGQEFGLLVYDSLVDLHKAERENNPMRMASEISWLALTYEETDFLAPQDVGLIHECGWEIADERAYPLISRAGAPDADLRPPTAADLLWLEEILPALVVYYEQYASDAKSAINSNTGILPFHYMDEDRSVKIAILKESE
jgi:hypothetical protein